MINALVVREKDISKEVQFKRRIRQPLGIDLEDHEYSRFLHRQE